MIHKPISAITALLLALNLVHAETRKPNILLIYADDMGYGEVSCYNPDRNKIPTPHIDKLASEGMRFTDAHSSSAVCSPSRYTLLTGRYHWRSRLQQGIVGLWEDSLIAPDRLTLGSLVREHGYHTAMVGKWHLGMDWPIPKNKRPLLSAPKNQDIPVTDEHKDFWNELFSQEIPGGPVDRGFDRHFGTDVPNWPPFAFFENRRTVGIPSEFLPVRLLQKESNLASNQGPALENWSLEAILPALGDRASKWIGEYAQSDKPFFLFMPLTTPHTPISPSEAWQGKSDLGPYGDLVMETDATVGQVLAALEKSGAADNTLVIFTTDNGFAHYVGVKELEEAGHFPSGPLRGYKSDIWEGGHRVPTIVRWPGKVEPGSVNDQLVHQADLLATVADLLGHELPADAGEDSFSLLPLFRDPATAVRQHAINQSIRGLLAVRQGSWKLIFGQGSGGWTEGGDPHPAQLYHLADDPGEIRNLYAENPERVAAMTTLMEKLVTDGRSTPGEPQENDVSVKWRRFLKK